MKLKFEELPVGAKFKAANREWEKLNRHHAKCLSKDAPYDPDAKIGIDRKAIVDVSEHDPAIVFKRGAACGGR